MILSSHGMDLIEQVCERIAIIVGGEVLAEGTVDEVRAGQTLEQRFVELSGSGSEVEGAGVVAHVLRLRLMLALGAPGG